MPAFFVPARSSRHRTACFALYKALLRQAPKVPLPNDVVVDSGPVNPIKHLIRVGFRRNRADTSPRLVVSALKNGYKFLTLLTRAATPSSPEHTSILTFLTAQLAKRAHLATLPRAPKGTSAPHPSTTPLLTLTSTSPPAYTATARPLPLARLRGARRRVPVLAAEANGFPFLRLGKPQSRVLERVLRQKTRRRGRRAARVHELEAEEVGFAAAEDEWEERVGGLLRGEEAGGVKRGRARGERRGGEGTYEGGVLEGIRYLQDSLRVEKVDMVARASAMYKIVVEERALAEKEKAERMERKLQRRAAWEAKMKDVGTDP